MVEITFEKLEDFVAVNELPMIVEFSQEMAETIFEEGRKHHLLLFVKKQSDEFAGLLETLKEVAPQFRGKVCCNDFLCNTLHISKNINQLY